MFPLTSFELELLTLGVVLIGYAIVSLLQYGKGG